MIVRDAVRGTSIYKEAEAEIERLTGRRVCNFAERSSRAGKSEGDEDRWTEEIEEDEDLGYDDPWRDPYDDDETGIRAADGYRSIGSGGYAGVYAALIALCGEFDPAGTTLADICDTYGVDWVWERKRSYKQNPGQRRLWS